MNFINLMSSKRFSPTAAQMLALRDATFAVTKAEKVQATQLVEVCGNKAVLVVGKARYEAVQLASNGRWYLSGAYSY